MSSKGQRKGKRQPKPRPKQAAPAVQPKTPHPIRTTLKVLSALVVAGMILYLAISWGSIPDQVPTTFDANGEPLAFTSRSYLLACPILGRPNAGKSSLLNALAGYDRAIVTDIPGTTRDTLEVNMELGGLPVRLIDTAGLRQSDDPIE